jgi:uncharacterized membrane protein
VNLTIWVLQILLALAFLAPGLTKTTQPRQKLATAMGWVEDFSDTGVRIIGALEILGPLGYCCRRWPGWPPCSSRSRRSAWPW